MAKWRLLYHIVWTTKNREPLIQPEMEGFLYRRLSVRAHDRGGYAFAINGMPDHVHLIVSIPPTVAIANYIGDLKGFSSRIMGLEFKIPFAWQHGYGGFSISQKNLAHAIAYVENQKEHHSSGTTVYLLECTSDEDEGPESMSSNPN